MVSQDIYNLLEINEGKADNLLLVWNYVFNSNRSCIYSRILLVIWASSILVASIHNICNCVDILCDINDVGAWKIFASSLVLPSVLLGHKLYICCLIFNNLIYQERIWAARWWTRLFCILLHRNRDYCLSPDGHIHAENKTKAITKNSWQVVTKQLQQRENASKSDFWK